VKALAGGLCTACVPRKFGPITNATSYVDCTAGKHQTAPDPARHCLESSWKFRGGRIHHLLPMCRWAFFSGHYASSCAECQAGSYSMMSQPACQPDLAQQAHLVILVLPGARCAMQDHLPLGLQSNAQVAKLAHMLTGDREHAPCVRPTPTARLERVAVSRAPRVHIPKWV